MLASKQATKMKLVHEAKIINNESMKVLKRIQKFGEKKNHLQLNGHISWYKWKINVEKGVDHGDLASL